MKFANKVAIITGGGRDIGKSVSEKLAAGGARVIVNYRSDEAAAQATVDGIVAAADRRCCTAPT